jgi:hypothetical protein
MNLKPKDPVIILPTKEKAIVVATHTYSNGAKVVSVKGEKSSTWLAINDVAKVN